MIQLQHFTDLTSIARTTGTQILQNQGAIRNLNNYGVFDLPRPTTTYQTRHHKGHYFTLLFDSSSKTLDDVRRQLSLNPHMIRFSVAKIGDKLGGIRNQPGKIEDINGNLEWNSNIDNSLQKTVETASAFLSPTLKTELPRSRHQAMESTYHF